MDILFCLNPLLRKEPEPQFEPEYEASRELGFRCHLFDFDQFTSDEIDSALAALPVGKGETLLYRGWIFKEEEYKQLSDALTNKGYRLFSTPEQYAEVNYFPSYYQKIEGFTPKAAWTESADTYDAWQAARKLGDGPWVLKDHVKSAKHFWEEACYVPNGAGREAFEEVAANLKLYQGRRFERGFVVKEFVSLKQLEDGPTDYPFCEEYRLFFWKGELLSATHYHRRPENPVDLSGFIGLAERFSSPFFTMDIAQTATGEWLVIDMGAGEVSSLPPKLKASEFYAKLKEKSS